MSKFKAQFILDIAQYPKAIASSIIYDCSEFFKMVEDIKDKKSKKIVAKKLASYLWLKYMTDKDNDIHLNLKDLISDKNIIATDLLIHTINFLDSTADEKTNEQLLEISKKKLEYCLDKLGKYGRDA